MNSSILIVDDVAKNIQLVAKFLKNEGYQLFFAQDGLSALKQIDSRLFDLILLDIMMPGMDGFEVCRRIKENKKTSSIPVIFLTARTDDDAIAKGFAYGGIDYITKPFNPAELIARVKTHLQLRQREIELQETNSTKDTLLSIISHDLKTPFFNIMGLGEILLNNYDEYDKDMIRELIENMVTAAKVSHNLLENLLNWIRVQTGKMKFDPDDLKLSDIIDDNFSLLKSQSDNKEIEFIKFVNDNIVVNADRNMLNIVLRNLISNAIKYTPRKGKVTVKAEKKGENVILSVMDNGVGIPENKIKTLFKPIDNTSTPGTESEPGTGFGLILTHEFVIKNNGSISVKSKEGEGTEFRLILPAG
ncbi:MAG: hybrid sensor histidine kinase/response regulator [Bacteroidales bacterium]|nr:hybrid sensor histidine kinase/response regulator [Bacteroidales bacterium]